MANAGNMIDTCFRLQHPELYPEFHDDQIVEVPPEFPLESRIGAEYLPEGANAEGYVWPEPMGEAVAATVIVLFRGPGLAGWEPKFQNAVTLAAQRLADLTGEPLWVGFQLEWSCCSCNTHLSAAIGRRLDGKPPFTLIHYARDLTRMEAPQGKLIVLDDYHVHRHECKLAPGPWDIERTAEMLGPTITKLFRSHRAASW